MEGECVISSGILFPALSFDLCSSVVQTICRNIAKPSYFVIFYFSHLSAYAIKIIVFSLDLYQRRIQSQIIFISQSLGISEKQLS